MKRIWWVAVLLMPAACAFGDLRPVTAAYVGCTPEAIEIRNDNVGFNQRSWEAVCNGRHYQCAAVSRAGVACTELH